MLNMYNCEKLVPSLFLPEKTVSSLLIIKSARSTPMALGPGLPFLRARSTKNSAQKAPISTASSVRAMFLYLAAHWNWLFSACQEVMNLGSWRCWKKGNSFARWKKGKNEYFYVSSYSRHVIHVRVHIRDHSMKMCTSYVKVVWLWKPWKNLNQGNELHSPPTPLKGQGLPGLHGPLLEEVVAGWVAHLMGMLVDLLPLGTVHQPWVAC